VVPANFTLPAGVSGGVKLGHNSEHIFKTIMTGIGGTPMPAFEDNLTPEEIWDMVHFVQSLRVDAHQAELMEAGLKEVDVEDARKAIWAVLSPAARRGDLDVETLQARRSSQESQTETHP
jgi:cytochrome c oxidase cbb3-type subunit I/II